MRTYVIKSLVGEAVLVCAITIALSFSDLTPLCDSLDLAGFVEALFDLNIAMVFSLFLSIFLSGDNPALNDARSHSAYVQPIAISVINSFLLCVTRLNKFSNGCNCCDIIATVGAAVVVIANIWYSWKIFCICRAGWNR